MKMKGGADQQPVNRAFAGHRRLEYYSTSLVQLYRSSVLTSFGQGILVR